MDQGRSPKSLVLDASVLIKTILPEKAEDDIKIALNLFKAYAKGNFKIILPIFWNFEVGNILIRKLSSENLITKFSALLIADFEEYKFNEEENLTIARFAKKYSTSFYDASYHLLAKFIDGVFVTADKKYFQKFKNDKNIALLENLKL